MPREKKVPPPGIAANLTWLMRERGVSGVEIEEATGVHNSTISRWKNGGRQDPSGPELATVASYLGTTSEALLSKEPLATADARTIERMRDLPARGLAEVNAEMKAAIDSFVFPTRISTPEMVEIINELRAEAFRAGDTYLPPSHWTNRLAQGVAARKGKLEDNTPAESASTESPEVTAYKQAKKAGAAKKSTATSSRRK